jgi:negative regulator of flagellin synthesis FlgM
VRIEESNQQVSLNYVRDNTVNQVQPQQQSAQQPEPAKKAAESDRLAISQTATTINEAASSANDADQFRADRVAELKSKVESGSYSVNSRDVAEKMLPRIGSFLKGASA